MDFKEIFKSFKELPRECYLCGAKVVKPEEDHLPPKCIFPCKYWSRLISVPICKQCHDKRDKDDEYFRDYISLWCGKNVPEEVHQKRQESWEQREAHKIGTLKHLIPVWVELRSGLTVPGYALKGEMKRINPVLECIAKGHYFSLRERRIPESDCLIVLTRAPFLGDSIHTEARFWSNITVPQEVIPGMFRFSMCCAQEGTMNKSNWYLGFYNAVEFFVQYSWETNRTSG